MISCIRETSKLQREYTFRVITCSGPSHSHGSCLFIKTFLASSPQANNISLRLFYFHLMHTALYKRTRVPPMNKTKSVPAPVTAPKEKRWSFRRSVTMGNDSNSQDCVNPSQEGLSKSHVKQRSNEVAVAITKIEAGDVAVDMRHTTRDTEETAAIKIQSIFRSHLVIFSSSLYQATACIRSELLLMAQARRALRALKGLVKLQALVRGHLVRKEARATLRCMQALVTVQARARAQRVQIFEGAQSIPHTPTIHRRSKHPPYTPSYVDHSVEENVKIVEMDTNESRNTPSSRKSYSINHTEGIDKRYSKYYHGIYAPKKIEYQQISHYPPESTDIIPESGSWHFEEFPTNTPQSSPQCPSVVSISDATQASFAISRQGSTYSMTHEYPFFPNYMANTESSKAKARSQSAPKQRIVSFERQPSRQRPSVEGRHIPRCVKMQRSASHICSTAKGYQYGTSIKLNQSNISLVNSECGSTSTILTTASHCRPLVTYEVHESRQ